MASMLRLLFDASPPQTRPLRSARAGRSLLLAATLTLVVGLAGPPTAPAQTSVKIGPRMGVPVGNVSDAGGTLFFGADARVDLAALPDPVVLSPSFDFYLTDDFSGSSLTIFALDLNGLYEIPLEDSPVAPYAGGGIAITRVSIEEDVPDRFDPSSTEIGLNLVGGTRFPLESVEPFAQINVTAGADRIGLAGGVLFSF